MKLYRKALYVLSWIPVALIKIALVLLGLIAVPWALFFPRWPKFLWLWGNDEEGCPAWWGEMALAKGGFIKQFPRFWWYAVRNPVNNMRYIFKDREANIEGWGPIRMEAQDLIDNKLDSASRWAWNGPFAGYRRVWVTQPPVDSYYTNSPELDFPGKYSEFWIGWKVGSHVPGMGFAMQLRRNRDIGT